MGVPFAELIGDPVAHSLSPAIHGHWLDRLGLEGDYRATRVTADDLAAFLEARAADPDWVGCNVTMPLKEPAAGLVDLDRAARKIGAVNTIVRGDGGLIGHDTDWQALDAALGTSRPRRAAIVGTGGAARAALWAMHLERRRNPSLHVTIVSRNPDKAAFLFECFDLAGEILPLGSAPEADLLVNASPLGMRGFPLLDLDLSALEPDASVVEWVYEPVETMLVQTARDKGLRVVDGVTMLIEQAAMAFALLFRESPAPADTAALRARLAA